MSLTRNDHNVADVLSNHTVFEVECIDRMYLNVYVPGLQYAGGLVLGVSRGDDVGVFPGDDEF